MTDRSNIFVLLDERPDLEPAVEAILEPEEPWTFEDVDIDSGAFGELVSRGIVEEHDDGYRVTNPDTVRAALENPDPDAHRTGDDATTTSPIELPTLSWSNGIAVAGALLFFALLRLTSAPTVFQSNHTVLSGNDPYYYRYLIEQSLVSDTLGLTTFPRQVTKGEPLLVATLQAAAKLAGGTPEATGLVMAWYPVVTAVFTGVLLYILLTLVTTDRRIAVSALLLFALTPGHAFRTSLGFADHHAFDYVWLVVTALAVVILVVETTRRDRPRITHTFVGICTLGAGVAGQTLAWEAGPLLLVPLGIHIALDTLLAVHTDRSPVRTAGPLIVGIGLGAAVTWAAHTTLGWHTALVAASPALLFAGGVTVTTLSELGYRLNLHTAVPTIGGLSSAIAALVVLPGRYPEQWNRLVVNLETRLLRTDAIAETGGLFGGSFGWLLLFGFVFILAVPYLLLATHRARDHPSWVPLVVYTWYFIGLAVIQIRFVGQMAPFVAIFAGIGFVHLAEWVDIIEEPPAVLGRTTGAVRHLTVPDRATLQSLVVLLLLVGSLSFVQIPIKTSQLTHSDAQYATASWMATTTEDRNLESPDSYVFSQWGDNRFYNYLVNGNSRSYGFARANYAAFLSGTDAQQWYEQFRGQIGFIVVSPTAVGNATAIGTRLYGTDGARTDTAEGLAHYRLVYVSDNERYKVFTLVPGATITGSGPPNETISVRADVTVGTYSTTYERRVETGANGNYSVTVPYATEYRVMGESIVVTDAAVVNGTTVTGS